MLLVGGTDGGNAEVLEADAGFLADHGCALPVVVAGNAESATRVAALLADGGTPYVVADNVVPKIGVLAPDSARRAIREVFLRHVIGGKGLSRRADFTSMVQGPTPDLVLTGVELLAAAVGRAVAVVDVGGATTDVHSVVPLDPEDAGLSREVVASTPVTRTVEGDLGMRWSALSTWEAGVEAGLLAEDERAAAVLRADDPASSRAPTPSAGRICAWPAPPRPWPYGATSGALASWSGPTVASWSAPGRTCGRWSCWSARGASCDMPRQPRPAPSWRLRPVSRRRAGSNPSTRGW